MTVTVSPTWSLWAALVAIVTVVPFSSAPPRDDELGGGLMVMLSGVIVATCE